MFAEYIKYTSCNKDKGVTRNAKYNSSNQAMLPVTVYKNMPKVLLGEV